jgi:hypothetical protein
MTTSSAGSTRGTDSDSAPRGGSAADLVTLRMVDGSGALAGRRLLSRLAVLAVLAVSALVIASPAQADLAHTTTTNEYGKTGPAASGLGSGCYIAWQAELKRLYLFSDSKIYVLSRPTPGTISPLATIEAGLNSSCGDPHLAVDNGSGASKGNVYAVPSNGFIYGWSSSGAALSGFPVGPGSGEICGVAATNNGQVWGGYWSGGSVVKFKADASGAGTLTPGLGNNCKIAVDNSNNDLYIINYGGGGIYKLSAADGYATPVKLIESAPGNAGVAVNGARDRIYVPSGSTVKSYDTNTGELKEDISFGGFTNSVAVDEGNDTLFISDTSKGVIREMPAALVPTVTTGDPIGNTKVSGTVDPDGGGKVVDCYFEFGIENGPPIEYPSQVDCEQPLPIESTTAVSAVLPGIEGEKTYNYRLVASNEAAGGTSRGANKQITPHNVSNLKTEAATNITRTDARLNGSFDGNGQPTTFYFEYGLTGEPYEHVTSVEDAGEPNTPTTIFTDVTSLKAGMTYHFRVVAENTLGLSKAQDRTFVTSPAVKDLSTDPATNVLPGSATLNGSLDPDGYETTYYFQWGKDTTYGQELPIAPGEDVGTTAPGSKSVHQDLDNLEPGITYHYRIVAENETGETVGNDQSFITPQAPSINSFSSDNVTETTADLIATINPNGYDTTYYFEYGPGIDYGNRAPVPDDGFLPASNTSEPVTVPISGIDGRTYHFRLIAVNQWGETITPDQTFDFNPPRSCPNHTVRQQTGAAYLPDCRAYELVSPARAGGSALFPIGPASAYASSPGRFAYVGLLNVIPGSGEPPNGGFGGDTYVASRTATGWVTKYVGVAGYESIGQTGPPGGEWGNSTNGILSSRDMNRFLIWDRKQDNGFTLGGSLDGTYAPYVYDNEGNRVDRFPTNVAEVPNGLTDMNQGGYFGAVYPTPDFSHYVFSARKAVFAPGGTPDPPGSVYDNDTEARTVTLVSKLPGGNPIPQDPTAGNASEYIHIPAVSDDGSHILMSTVAPGGTTHLYMTIDQTDYNQVSVDAGSVNRGVKFEGMTADGSTVYFSTATKMTADDTDNSVDLYMWSDSTKQVTRVSVGPGSIGNKDSCSASWVGGCGIQVIPIDTHSNLNGDAQIIDSNMARETGEIYFYSPELLDGARGFANKRNLYVLREGDLQHVATMEPSSPVSRINVVPDGSWAAFITGTKLTSYNNGGVPEMYTYDVGARAIRCVSCIPDGSTPNSPVEGSQNGRFLTDDGRAFFATEDALVDQDANGIRDVYEFVDSRPQLISSGTGESQGNEFQPTGLVGVSADGTDAFISTYETLVGQDENGFFLKFYDARTGGGFPFDRPPTPCAAADECHGEDSSSPPPPQLGTTARLGSGGNLKPRKRACKKRKATGKHKRRCGKRKATKTKRGTGNG